MRSSTCSDDPADGTPSMTHSELTLFEDELGVIQLKTPIAEDAKDAEEQPSEPTNTGIIRTRHTLGCAR
jgi:hypothetical protein